MTQLIRYAIVGIASNTGGYLIYLLITWLGIDPKVAMTGLYFTGVLLGFLGNRHWTFSFQGGISSSFVRYSIVYLFGYILNFLILYFFVDNIGYSHQWVQGVAVFVVALFLYSILSFFVFPNRFRMGKVER